jgi:putative GTP pyrophosphokinase
VTKVESKPIGTSATADLSDRQELEHLLESAKYQHAVHTVRDLLRRHILRVLGVNWEKIHNDYGMYTINCRAKSTRRTLEKFDYMKSQPETAHVSTRNFYQFIPDLVGCRLVVVDPGHLLGLAQVIKNRLLSPKFEPSEPNHKTYRARHGRFTVYEIEKFRDLGYHVEQESTGYCSVHFVYRAGRDFFNSDCHVEEQSLIQELSEQNVIPSEQWRVEIQVRTMMDEAWGETDHFVRYESATLRTDPDMKRSFEALAAHLQVANYHVSQIFDAVRRKNGSKP